MFVHVENAEVTEWRMSDVLFGAWRQTTNLEALSDPELNELGWQRIDPAFPTYDPATHELGSPTFAIDGGTVSVTWSLIDLPNPVPATVPNANMRIALRDLGLLAAVKAAAAADRAAHNAIDATDDGEFWERWEYGNFISRQDPLVLQMQAALGKTDAELDDLFRLAATK